MQKIAMLGSGFIGRFYADSLQGYRNKDKIVSIYSRREESAKKFAQDYNVQHWTTSMEESIARPEVDVVCISLPNNLHEEAVLLCCKHKKASVEIRAQAQGLMIFITYGVGMLIGTQIAGELYNSFLEDSASLSLLQWQHFWWIPASFAGGVFLFFIAAFNEKIK